VVVRRILAERTNGVPGALIAWGGRPKINKIIYKIQSYRKTMALSTGGRTMGVELAFAVHHIDIFVDTTLAHCQAAGPPVAVPGPYIWDGDAQSFR
jgi:hypothetical protein